MERLHVTPTSRELVVLIPERGGIRLPPEGLEVVRSSYWTRRIQDGSVTERPAGAPLAQPQPEHRPRARARGEESPHPREG